MRNFIDIINENSDFDSWFGDSKVVDQSGNPLMVYHGTNQNFDSFSKDRGGMITGPEAGAAHGFFFTNNKDEAQQYAESAGRKQVANIDEFERVTAELQDKSEKLMKIAQRTGKDTDWQAYEEASLAWEEYETGAIQQDHSLGVNVVSAYLSLQNPLIVDFKSHIKSESGDIGETVDRALQDGHDGVIMQNIWDSPLGGFLSTHYVAFSAKQIRKV